MKDISLNENKYSSFDHPSIEKSILKIYTTPKLKRVLVFKNTYSKKVYI